MTFNSDGTVFSQDGTVLNRAVNPNNILPDSQRQHVGVHVNSSDFASFQQHGGAATHGSSTTHVQLHADTGLVKVAGYETTPEVAATLQKAAPELFEAPEAKAAEAAKTADTAKAEEIAREDLNRHPDDQIEAAHQHFNGEVSAQNRIALMVYGQRGEAPPEALLNRIAEEMHVPLHEAIDKINGIGAATGAQFTVLARSMGVDADKAADWIKANRRDTGMVAAQAHWLRRDLMAWKPLLSDYKAATGDGRARS
jgi:hypothetical protein